MSTPTKISPRNPACRLCGDSHESRYMLRLFSKSGSEEDLCAKVHNTCGIKISEDDTRSKVLCRSCVSFVNKMEQFIQRAQSRKYAVGSKLRICCKAMRSALAFFASAVEAFINEYAIRKLCARGWTVEANHTNKKAALLLNSTSCDSCNA